ncbi:HTH domain-containing protein [Vibrio alginolyticus]|uniref:helix-turn-helix transcriptional regulator n=1 Tax=Vibrio alginolyticus TaxID=663 RepID=UPI001EEA7D67|nr:HTH domain-containing protein [Vibrio alginolyticus]MCG6307075.1 HTH domain-containing protein [Vibrio alginolyticus]HCG6383475.1 HTH domain-containing protein [Vibrio parahaemolyticus]
MTFDLSRHCNTATPLHIISKKELAKQLNVNERTIHRMIKDKRLPEPMRTLGGNNGGWLSTTLLKWQNTQKGR